MKSEDEVKLQREKAYEWTRVPAACEAREIHDMFEVRDRTCDCSEYARKWTPYLYNRLADVRPT